MGTCTCVNCHTEVSRFEARVRSVAFRQVAWCQTCWDELHAVEVPTPRQAADELSQA